VGDPGNHYGAVWGDYDNDGDLDVLLTGIRDLQVFPWINITEIYNNDGSGSFTAISAGLPAASKGNAFCGQTVKVRCTYCRIDTAHGIASMLVGVNQYNVGFVCHCLILLLSRFTPWDYPRTP